MQNSNSDGYDLVGDIHGCAETLSRLLHKLDYRFQDGCYRHSSRQMIFVGDFIDRGPLQRETLELVRPMVERGAARAVMGNHEFNALAYHCPDGKGGHLRKHSPKNQKQHQAFLDAYTEEGTRREALDWFFTLPLFLQLDGLRVVHAAWLPEQIERFRQWSPSNLLTPELLKSAVDKSNEVFEVVETLLKGWETELPEGVGFLDKDGHRRTRMRTQWWEPLPKNRSDASLGPPVPEGPMEPPAMALYPASGCNVFVGHYWLTGPPRLWAPNVCCLDYSVGKSGQLVAYRWNGEERLRVDHMVGHARVEP